jgi:hypothetical protein
MNKPSEPKPPAQPENAAVERQERAEKSREPFFMDIPRAGARDREGRKRP